MLLVLGATVGAASASHLTLDAGSLSAATVTHPCPDQATAFPSAPSGAHYVGVTVTLPSTDCDGRLVQVTVLDGAAVVAQDEVSVTGVTATLTGLDAYTAETGYTVQATVGGWDLPTTWTFEAPAPVGPITPGNATTELESVTWVPANHNQVCATITVRSDDPSQPWRLDVNVAEAPFYGQSSGYSLNTGAAVFVPVVNGVGHIDVASWVTTPGQSQTFTLCNYALPQPPDQPSAYSVTTAQGTGSDWSRNRACMITTVAGNGTSDFYFSWSASIDMTAAWNRVDVGHGASAVTLSRSDNIATHSLVSGRLYRVQSGWQGVLKGTESLTFALCAVRY